MSDPSGRPREARVDEAVRDAVVALLATEGYAGTTIAAVAARAGVGRGALYRRWRSKAELVFANVIHPVELAEPEDRGTLGGDIEALSLRIAELTGSAAARAAIRGLATDPELGGALDERVFEAERRHLERILTRASIRGELGPGVDPDLVRRLLVGPIALAPLFSPTDGDPREIARVVTAGLLATHTPRESP
ncbi:MAG: TetR-like C-terminal domain-containing protein [Thermoleophilia bacterium]